MTALRDPETGRFTSTPVVALDPIREIVCSNCGEPLGEYSRTERTKVGRCCFNLPDPWEVRSEEEAEDDAEAECDCWDCRYDARSLDHWDFVDDGRSLDAYRMYTQTMLNREPSAVETAAFTAR